MHSRKFALFIAIACMLTLVSVNAFSRSEPAAKSAVGTWKLDLSKSSFGSVPAPKFEQMVITTDAATAIKWTLTGALPDGKTYLESYDGPVDGKYHKMTSGLGASTVAYTRTATGGLQWVIKDTKDSVIETGDGQLSPDGKTLTLKGTMQGPNGKSNFTAVYGRVK